MCCSAEPILQELGFGQTKREKLKWFGGYGKNVRVASEDLNGVMIQKEIICLIWKKRIHRLETDVTQLRQGYSDSKLQSGK